LHAAGQLRAVVVPAPELEALRDLVRAREDLRGDLMAARHRISKLLLRRGLVWAGPGETWGRRHVRWLSTLRLNDALADVVVLEAPGFVVERVGDAPGFSSRGSSASSSTRRCRGGRACRNLRAAREPA
jgi:hypothetical protein